MDARHVEVVEGHIYVFAGAELHAPKLVSVGGEVQVFDDAKLDAPMLTTVGREFYAAVGADIKVPSLCSVGRLSVHCEAKLNSLAFVGGEPYVVGETENHDYGVK